MVYTKEELAFINKYAFDVFELDRRLYNDLVSLLPWQERYWIKWKDFLTDDALPGSLYFTWKSWLTK